MDITNEMVEAAAMAMVVEMFAPHELPVDEDIWHLYCKTARHALTAALTSKREETR